MSTELVATTGSAHEGRPTVLARFPHPAAARRAIETVEARGIDAGALALAGTRAPEPVLPRGAVDPEVVNRTTGWMVLGLGAGTLAGAIVGAAFVGAVLLAWPGDLAAESWIFALTTGWFAAAGGVFGAFVAVNRKTGFSDAWGETFQDAVEPVWLGIFDEHATPEVLEGTEAIELLDHPDVEIHHPRMRMAS
jgi:hypothetical protein